MAASESVPTPSNTEVDEKKVKEEYKRTSFDKEFRNLMKQAQETIQSRYGFSMDLGDVRPELICLTRYGTIYNNMKPEEHYCYFETLYNRNRTAILNCLKDDRWIRTGKLCIQFGEGFKGMERKCKQIRIMLSDIFLIACELQENAEKSLDGIDEKFAQEAGGKDLIRPNILLLHLMRIFYHLNDGDDKIALGKIVTQIEDELGVKNKTVGSEPWKSTINAALPPMAATSGGISSLFDMAKSMMEKMGFKPPPGLNSPTESEISSAVTNIFNHEVTQNALQNMITGLDGCQDFPTAIQQVMKNVADPATLEAMQTSVAQTAHFANQM